MLRDILDCSLTLSTLYWCSIYQRLGLTMKALELNESTIFLYNRRSAQIAKSSALIHPHHCERNVHVT